MGRNIRAGRTTAGWLVAGSAAVGVALALPGCSNRVLDTGPMGFITGETAPVSDNPSLIRPMDDRNTDYPNLGTVPPRPTNMRTDAQRAKEVDRLAQDRVAARKERDSLPTPADVPPKPDLTPGKAAQ